MVMNEIKMSVFHSRRLRPDYLSRWTIKIRLWKNGQKACGIMSCYDGNDIEVQRAAPLSVCA